jgi:hypothetical protein
LRGDRHFALGLQNALSALLGPIDHITETVKLQTKLREPPSHLLLGLHGQEGNETQTVEVKLIRPSEECPVLQFRAYSIAPVGVINLPPPDLLLCAWSRVSVEQMMDRP